jgi:hypothetical protein
MNAAILFFLIVCTVAIWITLFAAVADFVRGVIKAIFGPH